MFSISTVGGLAGGGDGTPGAAPLVGLGDPFWENVVLYSRMDADPPIDLSISSHTITDGGAGATLDASNQRFGTGCRDYDGSSTGEDTVPDNTDFEFGAGDFTIECWARWTTLSDAGLVSRWTTTGNHRSWTLFYDDTGGDLEFFYSTNGTDEVQPL